MARPGQAARGLKTSPGPLRAYSLFVSETVVAPHGSTEPAEPSHPRGRGLRVVALVVALVAVAAGVRWYTHPDAFREMSGGVGTWGEVSVNEPIYVAMTFPWDGPDATVTIHSAEPRIVEDSADSRVEVVVCTLRPEASSAIGSVRGEDVNDVCATLAPIDETTYHLGGGREDTPGQQILLVVTPAQRGTVEIAGVDLDYSDGWQRGTRPVGEHVRFDSR